MEPKEIIEGVRDALSVRRVFGEPIERDGVTVIPASAWIGGGGGGSGSGGKGGTSDVAETGDGGGMGFGGLAWASGVFEIRGDRVTWHPAIDLSRILMLLVPIALALIRAFARR
jgi:uncharacterized spore protein YtfJ